MPPKQPQSNGDIPGDEIDESLLDYLSEFFLGDISGIDLDEFDMDRRTAERQLRLVAEELGMKVEFRNVLGFQVTGGPPRLPEPRAAWLLFGDATLYPSPEQLRHADLDTDPDDPQIWSGSPLIAPGDLLLFYFGAPHHGVHFLARAVDRPFWSDLDEEATGDVDLHAWWVPYTAMVKIDPIGPAELVELLGVDSEAFGRGSLLVRAAAANRLLEQVEIADTPADWCMELALEDLIESEHAPDGAEIDLIDLIELPSAAITSEGDVASKVVEPLLRLAGLAAPDFEVRKDFPVGRDTVDYAVLEDGDVRCLVDIKLRVRLYAAWDWSECPDVDEVAAHADALDVPFLIVDCDQIFGFMAGDREPFLALDRFELSDDDLDNLQAFVALLFE